MLPSRQPFLTPTLIGASAGHIRRHPWQFGLSLLGIALGVAVVIAIELSSVSARRAFELSQQSVVGGATHRVVAGASGLDERIYPLVRRQLDGSAAAPVVEGHVSVAGRPGRTLTLL